MTFDTFIFLLKLESKVIEILSDHNVPNMPTAQLVLSVKKSSIFYRKDQNQIVCRELVSENDTVKLLEEKVMVKEGADTTHFSGIRGKSFSFMVGNQTFETAQLLVLLEKKELKLFDSVSMTVVYSYLEISNNHTDIVSLKASTHPTMKLLTLTILDRNSKSQVKLFEVFLYHDDPESFHFSYSIKEETSLITNMIFSYTSDLIVDSAQSNQTYLT